MDQVVRLGIVIVEDPHLLPLRIRIASFDPALVLYSEKMRVLSTPLVVFIALGAAARALTPVALAATQTAGSVDGLYSLIQRRIPAHSESFNFSLTPDDSVLDTFTLSDADTLNGGTAQINVQCTSLSACARGLYT